MTTNTYHKFATILKKQRQQRYRRLLQVILVVVIVAISFFLIGLLDWERLAKGVPSGINLIGQMIPPDFSSATNWIKPLFDTLAMSVAATAIAVTFSLPLSLLAAGNTTPHQLLFRSGKMCPNHIIRKPRLLR